MPATCSRKSIRVPTRPRSTSSREIWSATRLSSPMPAPIFTRYNQLGDKGWATPQLIETQKAQVGQLEAAIKTDQALIEAAKVQLSYTRLTSPIDGVVGIRQIDVGNIISPTTANGLVVVTQLDPISLIFTLPEGVLPQILKQQQATKTPLTVIAYNQDDTIELGQGVLALVNNEILQTTGSIQLKATFPNKSRIAVAGRTGQCAAAPHDPA